MLGTMVPLALRDGIALLEALPVALLALDGQGKVSYANPRALEIVGRPLDAVLGERVEALLAPLEVLSRKVSPSQDDSSRDKLVLRGPQGSVIGFRLEELKGSDTEPLETRYLVVFQDITNVEKLREERNKLLRLAAVGETLPGVLHEIKNPLAAITTEVEVLLEEVPEGHVRRELTAILGEVRRIKLALEGIGLFQTTPHTTRRSAVDRALREAFLVIEPQLKAKGIRGMLRVRDLPTLPLDSAVVRAFFFNLMTNAIHACDADDQIVVSARVDGDTFELEVSDSGCGMTPEVLARCRELFFTTKSNGSGIGLALCASVTESAGGKLQIDSRVGAGTTVTVRLPVKAASSGTGPV